jgi:hypothetical protein
MLVLPATLCLAAFLAVPVAAQEQAVPARLDADIDTPELAEQVGALERCSRVHASSRENGANCSAEVALGEARAGVATGARAVLRQRGCGGR